jgi:hypothetical protein
VGTLRAVAGRPLTYIYFGRNVRRKTWRPSPIGHLRPADAGVCTSRPSVICGRRTPESVLRAQATGNHSQTCTDPNGSCKNEPRRRAEGGLRSSIVMYKMTVGKESAQKL